MPVVKYSPNPLGLSILAEFYGQYGKDPHFDDIIHYLESLEVNTYNPYHYLKKKEADRVNTVFSDIAVLVAGRVRTMMQGHPISVHEMVHFFNDSVPEALSRAALNRQEKICVLNICDRLQRLMDELKPPKQTSENLSDISRVVFDLVRELQCSCCKEIISQPRILRCGHAFCYQCIKNWFERTNITDCPQCRQMDIVGNADKFPRLPVLENVLKIVEHLACAVSKAQYEPERPPRPSCAVCTARPPDSGLKDQNLDSQDKAENENTNDLTHSLTEKDDKESADNRKNKAKAVSEKLWYDIELRLFLCSWCYEKQSMKKIDMQNQHPVYLDLLQDVLGQSTQLCEKHNFQVKAQWCNTCLITVCGVCHLLDHTSHCILHLSPEEALKHAAKEATQAYNFYRLMAEKLKVSLQDIMERQQTKFNLIVQAYKQLDPKHHTERGHMSTDTIQRKSRATCENITQFIGNFLQKLLEEVRICQSATQLSENLTGKKLRQRLHVGNTHAKNIPDQMRYCKDFFASILESYCRIQGVCDSVKLLTEQTRAVMTQEAVRDRLRHMAKDLTRGAFMKDDKTEKEAELQTANANKTSVEDDKGENLPVVSVKQDSNEYDETDQKNQGKKSNQAAQKIVENQPMKEIKGTEKATDTPEIQRKFDENQNITDEQKQKICVANLDTEEPGEDLFEQCDSKNVEHFMVHNTAQNLIASVYEKILAEQGILQCTVQDLDCSMEHSDGEEVQESVEFCKVHDVKEYVQDVAKKINHNNRKDKAEEDQHHVKMATDSIEKQKVIEKNKQNETSEEQKESGKDEEIQDLFGNMEEEILAQSQETPRVICEDKVDEKVNIKDIMADREYDEVVAKVMEIVTKVVGKEILDVDENYEKQVPATESEDWVMVEVENLEKADQSKLKSEDKQVYAEETPDEVMEQEIVDVLEDKEITAEVEDKDVIAEVEEKEIVAEVDEKEIVAEVDEKEIVAEVDEKEIVAEVEDKGVIAEEEKEIVAEIDEKEIVAEVDEKEIVAEVEDKAIVAEAEDEYVIAEFEEKEIVAEGEDKKIVAEIEDKDVIAEVEEKEIVAEVEVEIVAEVEDKEIVADIEDKDIIAEVEEKGIVTEVVDKEVVAEVEDKKVVAQIEDKAIVAEVGDKEIVSEVEEKETVAEVVDKEVVAELEDKKVVAEVVDKNIVAEVEDKQIVAEIEDKETIAEVEDKETIAEVEDKKILAEVGDKEIIAEVEDKDVIAEVEDKETIAEVEDKESIVEVQEKEIVAKVENKEIIAEAEDKEFVAKVEVKETIAEVEDKEGVAEVEDKEGVAEVEDKEGVAEVEDKEGVAEVEDKKGVAEVEDKEGVAEVEDKKGVAEVEDKMIGQKHSDIIVTEVMENRTYVSESKVDSDKNIEEQEENHADIKAEGKAKKKQAAEESTKANTDVGEKQGDKHKEENTPNKRTDDEQVLGCGDVQDRPVRTPADGNLNHTGDSPKTEPNQESLCKASPNKPNKKNKKNRKKNKW